MSDRDPFAWRVHVAQDWQRNGKTLHAYRQRGDGKTEYLTSSPLVMKSEHDGVQPTDAGLYLPDDFWRSLVDEITPPPSTDGEIRRLEEALAVERQRVDLALRFRSNEETQ